MADANDAAAKEAQRKEIKDLMKEAYSEIIAEAESKRTESAPKKSGGFFDGLFG